MLNPVAFYEQLRESGVHFASGVPDSVLKELCGYLAGLPLSRHQVAVNEGQAIALACGYHFATGCPALVYMQNSGLGNALNPLVSLSDSAVYGVPLILVIGWRGEPGAVDEPQHERQGEMTVEQLELLGIPARIVPDDIEGAAEVIARAVDVARDQQAPYALLVRPGTFDRGPLVEPPAGFAEPREQIIDRLLDVIEPDDVAVATTGYTARELWACRRERGDRGSTDFLNIGAMGHASQIALGIALAKPQRRVWCLDGDGAALMHMGAFAAIGQAAPANLVHIILNNGVHDSVGAQPTAGQQVDFAAVAMACGYGHAVRFNDSATMVEHLRALRHHGPVCIEIRVGAGARSDLGRPGDSPQDRKITLMANLLREPARCAVENKS